jgi:hypothetical protein
MRVRRTASLSRCARSYERQCPNGQPKVVASRSISVRSTGQRSAAGWPHQLTLGVRCQAGSTLGTLALLRLCRGVGVGYNGNDAAPHARACRHLSQDWLAGYRYCGRSGRPRRRCDGNTRLRSEYAQRRRRCGDHLWICRAQAHCERQYVHHRFEVHDGRHRLRGHGHPARRCDDKGRRRGPHCTSNAGAVHNHRPGHEENSTP